MDTACSRHRVAGSAFARFTIVAVVAAVAAAPWRPARPPARPPGHQTLTTRLLRIGQALHVHTRPTRGPPGRPRHHPLSHGGHSAQLHDGRLPHREAGRRRPDRHLRVQGRPTRHFSVLLQPRQRRALSGHARWPGRHATLTPEFTWVSVSPRGCGVGAGRAGSGPAAGRIDPLLQRGMGVEEDGHQTGRTGLDEVLRTQAAHRGHERCGILRQVQGITVGTALMAAGEAVHERLREQPPTARGKDDHRQRGDVVEILETEDRHQQQQGAVCQEQADTGALPETRSRSRCRDGRDGQSRAREWLRSRRPSSSRSGYPTAEPDASGPGPQTRRWRSGCVFRPSTRAPSGDARLRVRARPLAAIPVCLRRASGSGRTSAAAAEVQDSSAGSRPDTSRRPQSATTIRATFARPGTRRSSRRPPPPTRAARPSRGRVATRRRVARTVRIGARGRSRRRSSAAA